MIRLIRAAFIFTCMCDCRTSRAGAAAASHWHRDLPVRARGGSVRRAGAQRLRAGRGADERRLRACAVCRQGLRRPGDRARRRRRSRRSSKAGRGVPQSRAARRPGRRLHLERRLPRDRARGGGAEEADRALRLRHAADFRGRLLQVRVPDRALRRDGQRRRGASTRSSAIRTSAPSRASTRTTPGARTRGPTSRPR